MILFISNFEIYFINQKNNKGFVNMNDDLTCDNEKEGTASINEHFLLQLSTIKENFVKIKELKLTRIKQNEKIHLLEKTTIIANTKKNHITMSMRDSLLLQAIQKSLGGHRIHNLIKGEHLSTV